MPDCREDGTLCHEKEQKCVLRRTTLLVLFYGNNTLFAPDERVDEMLPFVLREHVGHARTSVVTASLH